MTGLEEFLKTFGNITVSNVITVALAAVFLGMTYKKIRDYLIKKYEAEKEGYVHFAGIVLLMALMVFVMFNDVHRIFFGG